jgi:hypothetical protein
MATIETLRARVAKASAKMEALQSKILPPGDYEFTVLEAKEEHDDKREYDYWYLRLDCNGQTMSDRFPLVDNMFWKLGELLDSVGLQLESLTGVEANSSLSKRAKKARRLPSTSTSPTKIKEFGQAVILRKERAETRVLKYREWYPLIRFEPSGRGNPLGTFLHFFLFSIEKRRRCPF